MPRSGSYKKNKSLLLKNIREIVSSFRIYDLDNNVEPSAERVKTIERDISAEGG